MNKQPWQGVQEINYCAPCLFYHFLGRDFSPGQFIEAEVDFLLSKLKNYCSMNPACYAEKDYALSKPDGSRKSILVIGGGSGGMSAAITARPRGWDVELWEKSDRLEGTLWAAGGPDFKADHVKYLTRLSCQEHISPHLAIRWRGMV